jgi:hypothetical protein
LFRFIVFAKRRAQARLFLWFRLPI